MRLICNTIIGLILNPFSIVSGNSMNEAESLPNIVIIFADDFGYGDLSCYGATKIITPEVDKLASAGILFTDAYVVSALCSPSRYSLLTGRYSWRTHLKAGVLTTFAPPLIEESRTTLASMLKSKGYYTACVGKWHLGFNWPLNSNAPADASESVFNAWGTEPQKYIDFSKTCYAKPVKGGPVERGFDYFYGISGANNMMPFILIENDKPIEIPSIPNNFGTNALRAPNWDLRTLDQKFTEKALEVIDNHFNNNSTEPLFLYFPTSVIHRPCLPTFTKAQSQAGMRGDAVLEFDWMVGQLVKALEKHNVLENTIIIISSDNGPQPGDPYALVEKFRINAFGSGYDYYEPYFADFQPEYLGNGGQQSGWLVYGHDPTAGYRGFKGDAWEGGLRVPFIVHWPDKIKEGRINSNVISTVDIFATIAEIVGKELLPDEGEDSYSFLNNIMEVNPPPIRKTLTMVSASSGALLVRKDFWKYMEGLPLQNIQPQLYNLEVDAFEKNNLIDSMTEKVSELKSIIEYVVAHKKSELY